MTRTGVLPTMEVGVIPTIRAVTGTRGVGIHGVGIRCTGIHGIIRGAIHPTIMIPTGEVVAMVGTLPTTITIMVIITGMETIAPAAMRILQVTDVPETQI